jgi:hypothetical protein
VEISEQIDHVETFDKVWGLFVAAGLVDYVTTDGRRYVAAYEAGRLRIRHALELGQRKAVFESLTAVVAPGKMEAASVYDRLAVCYRDRSLRSFNPFCNDAMIQIRLERGDEPKLVLVEALEETMARTKKEPERAEARFRAMAGGPSVGAVSGGYPTLGKRR